MYEKFGAKITKKSTFLSPNLNKIWILLWANNCQYFPLWCHVHIASLRYPPIICLELETAVAKFRNFTCLLVAATVVMLASSCYVSSQKMLMSTRFFKMRRDYCKIIVLIFFFLSTAFLSSCNKTEKQVQTFPLQKL